MTNQVGNLVDDCWLEVFKFVGVRDLLSVRAVCRVFNGLAGQILPGKAVESLHIQFCGNPKWTNEYRHLCLRVASLYAQQIPRSQWETIMDVPLVFGLDSHVHQLSADQQQAFNLIQERVPLQGDDQFECAFVALTRHSHLTTPDEYNVNLRAVVCRTLEALNQDKKNFVLENGRELVAILKQCFLECEDKERFKSLLESCGLFKREEIQNITH